MQTNISTSSAEGVTACMHGHQPPTDLIESKMVRETCASDALMIRGFKFPGRSHHVLSNIFKKKSVYVNITSFTIFLFLSVAGFFCLRAAALRN